MPQFLRTVSGGIISKSPFDADKHPCVVGKDERAIFMRDTPKLHRYRNTPSGRLPKRERPTGSAATGSSEMIDSEFDAVIRELPNIQFDQGADYFEQRNGTAIPRAHAIGGFSAVIAPSSRSECHNRFRPAIIFFLSSAFSKYGFARASYYSYLANMPCRPSVRMPSRACQHAASASTCLFACSSKTTSGPSG